MTDLLNAAMMALAYLLGWRHGAAYQRIKDGPAHVAGERGEVMGRKAYGKWLARGRRWRDYEGLVKEIYARRFARHSGVVLVERYGEEFELHVQTTRDCRRERKFNRAMAQALREQQ